MPVKWSPETDQILLLKILETSDISPKCAEISSKWPTGLDRPTPRAISERIFKIRSTAKASGTAGHFSISSPATKSNTGGTPRKNAAVKTSLPKKTTRGKAEKGKRKRGAGEKSDEEASDDAEADTFNSDSNVTEASDKEAPTAKKSKTNNSAANGTGKNKTKNKRIVKIENEEEEENKTIHDKGYENAFGGGDDGAGVDDFA